MSTLRTLTLLIASCVMFASATASAASPQSASQDVQNMQDATEPKPAGEELGFMEKYIPFSLNENLSQPVDEAVFPTFAGSICLTPLGGWLVNYLVMGEQRPVESDALMVALAHCGIQFCLGVGSILVIPAILLLVDWLYVAPVAILNAQDRALKAQGVPPAPPAEGLREEDALEAPGLAMAF